VFSAARASRAVDPPTSSSLADEKRVGSLRLFCSLRSLRLALVSRCLPHSLADEKHVCSLASSRTAARQPGSARRRAIRGLIARCRLRDVRWVAAVFVGSGGTETRCSAISSCTQLAAGAGARCARAPMRDRRREHRGSAHFVDARSFSGPRGRKAELLAEQPAPALHEDVGQ
jgi:hypothetical protein